MKSILWYPYFISRFIVTLPAKARCKRIGKKEGTMAMRLFCNREIGLKYIRPLVAATGSRVHIEGLENIPADETVLFVSNHQSLFDLGIFLGFIEKPKGYIAKNTINSIPVLRTWMRDMGCVFIDRTDIKKSAAAIADGIVRLQEGYSMVVFPEGTRTKEDALHEFRAGSFKLATKAGVPIVPVTLDGTYKILEANRYKIRPADVYVTIHPPVETKDLNREEVLALPEKVKGIIAEGFRNHSVA